MAYDAAVIGAGHNGLTCAAYLARAGLKVLVLEAREVIGGMTMSDELAAPGFLSDVHASGYLVAKLAPVAEDFDLAGRGLDLITPDPNWAQVFPDGRSLLIGRDVEATAASIAQFSSRDAETWRTLYQRYLTAKPTIVRAMLSAPKSLAEELAAPHGADGYRMLMQSGRSWADETFESPELRLFFASAGLHFGLAPDDALGGHFAWLFFAVVQDVGCSIVKGGMHKVPLALAQVVEAGGGEVRTDAKVGRIEVLDGRAVAVHLADDERIAVDGPIAVNADPRHLVVDLLGPDAVGADLEAKLKRYEWGPSFFGIHLALDAPVDFKAAPAGQVCYVHASDLSVDALARMFVDIRAGRLPEHPMVGIVNESACDPSRVPEGKALMKFVVHFVPYKVTGDATGRTSGGPWDAIKDVYADYLLEWLDDAFLPGLRKHIIGRSIQSPVDYERRTSSSVHGTHMHGAFVPWQIGAFRPVPEMGHYQTPVPNVYLCGAGAHPGSGVSMAPGRNAAATICADLAIGFPGRAV